MLRSGNMETSEDCLTGQTWASGHMIRHAVTKPTVQPDYLKNTYLEVKKQQQKSEHMCHPRIFSGPIWPPRWQNSEGRHWAEEETMWGWGNLVWAMCREEVSCIRYRADVIFLINSRLEKQWPQRGVMWAVGSIQRSEGKDWCYVMIWWMRLPWPLLRMHARRSTI